MESKIKIFLADDHQVLIDGMKALLKTNEQFEVVGFALNGINLIEKVISSMTDILVMDINMPEKSGLDVLKELTQTDMPFKVIVLSSYDDLKLVGEVMKLGANGYLTKQCAGENIVEAIFEVQNGREYFCTTIREKICSSFTNNGSKAFNLQSNSSINLTDREMEILKLISMEYSGKEIGEELFISSNTVETHRKNLIKKLGVKTSVGLVKYALENNLINDL